MYFKFCPNCKAKLIHEVDRLIDCKECGYVYYLAPALTNGAIIENKKGEILLVKRKIPPKKGFWDVAGGFVNYQETLEKSLVREVKGELSVMITNIKYFTSQEDRYFFKGNNYYTLCAFFTGKVDEEKIIAADDISGYKFFPKTKIPFDKLAFEGLKKVIRKYLQDKS